MEKLKFDSTCTIKGVLFQFLIALEKCFEMQQGESVYIETYGDVSIIGDLSNSKQIESKFYKKQLTDLDKNIWKSIYNWMNIDFPIRKFSSLVLLTTQRVSLRSSWLNWNKKTPAERVAILKDIKKKFDIRKKKDKDLVTYMNVIFDTKNSTMLSQIAKMLYIDNVSMDGGEYHKYIQEKYGKCVPDIRKERFINNMFGFILNPNIVNHNWEISYEDFNLEVQEIAKVLIDTTTVFPTKLNLPDINSDEYENNAFVGKIRNIDYNEVIPEAVNDYVHTASLIEQELRESLAIKTQLETYEEAVERRYRTEYRKASKNYKKEERMLKSQELYDNMTMANDGTFHTYNYVPSYFHNGIMQILADEKDDIVWLLKEHKDE